MKKGNLKRVTVADTCQRFNFQIFIILLLLRIKRADHCGFYGMKNCYPESQSVKQVSCDLLCSMINTDSTQPKM